MKKTRPLLIVLFLIPVLLLACGKGDEPALTANKGGEESARQGPLVVYTTFYPTWYFTTVIGGKHVEAVNPVPLDADPIFWMPPRAIIQAYQTRADLIVLNGAGYAKWVEKATLPTDKIVDAGAAFKDRLIRFADAMTHSHGPAGEHTRSGIDAHTWMDPQLAMEQCRAIAAALGEHRPDYQADFEKNLAGLIGRLEELDQAFKELGKKYDGRPIVASHPAYNYLAKRYGWKVKSFTFDPEVLPETDAVMKLKAYLAEANPHPYILWEAPPSEEVEQHFEEAFEMKSLLFSPVEVPPGEGGDYLSVMKRNILNITPLFE